MCKMNPIQSKTQVYIGQDSDSDQQCPTSQDDFLGMVGVIYAIVIMGFRALQRGSLILP